MRVRWLRRALRDLDEIQDYIAADSPAAAFGLVNDIIHRTELLLAANPRLGRLGRVRGTRELVVGGTEYIVAYRITDSVEILAVVHGARDWPTTFS